MIMDYKKTLSPLVMLPPEERANSRVIPPDERFAAMTGARPFTTIMALNNEVKPLPGYGDTVIDVMCNLFPIRDILRGLPQGGTRQAIGQPDAYWRDLARNRVPWNKWTRAQQSNAADEYYAAVRATAPPLPQEPWEKKTAAPPRQTSDRDNELFALLAPYREDLKRFQENRTKITLTSSPNPSKTGDPVTLTAEVRTAGGRIPTGSVMIRFANRQMLVIYGNLRLSKRPLDDKLVFTRQVPLASGTARLILPGEATLADGRYLMYAS
jgi:hypothetical protein